LYISKDKSSENSYRVLFVYADKRAVALFWLRSQLLQLGNLASEQPIGAQKGLREIKRDRGVCHSSTREGQRELDKSSPSILYLFIQREVLGFYMWLDTLIVTVVPEPVAVFCMVYHYTKRTTLTRLLGNVGLAIYVVLLNKYFVILPVLIQ